MRGGGAPQRRGATDAALALVATRSDDHKRKYKYTDGLRKASMSTCTRKHAHQHTGTSARARNKQARKKTRERTTNARALKQRPQSPRRCAHTHGPCWPQAAAARTRALSLSAAASRRSAATLPPCPTYLRWSRCKRVFARRAVSPHRRRRSQARAPRASEAWEEAMLRWCLSAP